MPIYEVAVNLVEKPHSKVGAPVVAFPGKGTMWSAAEMTAWITTGAEPPWRGVRANRRRVFQNLVSRNRFWLNPALDHTATAQERYTADKRSLSTPWGALPQAQKDALVEEIGEMVIQAGLWRQKAITLGMHTRWGFEDLKHFGIAVMDVLPYVVEDMFTPDVDTEIAAPYPERRRLYKNSYVVDISSLSPQSRSEWEDRDKHVPPATTDPTWNDADAWDETKVSRFTQERQNKLGERI
jgi:hypothetical protein